MDNNLKLTKEMFKKGNQQHKKIVSEIHANHKEEYDRESFLVDLVELVAELKNIIGDNSDLNRDAVEVQNEYRNIKVIDLYDLAIKAGRKLKSIELEK